MFSMNKKSAACLMSGLILSLQTLPVMAQKMSDQEIVNAVVNRSETVGFTGKRTLLVKRQNSKDLEATAEVEYADRNNYRAKITGPTDIRNIEFRMVQGANSAFFPDEKLYLFNGGKNTSYMPERIILSTLTSRPDLLTKNYTVQRQPDAVEAFNNVYVLDFVPKNSFENQKNKLVLTPRRRYSIHKETFHILREQRFWDEFKNGQYVNSPDAFADAKYSTFSTQANKPSISEFKSTDKLNRVNLGGQEKNSFLSYASVQAAEAQEKMQINAPSYLPEGFALKDIQVFTLFGARIQLLNYSDGLNDLMISIRPQQNAFVTLLAGAFSLNLIKKVSDLSHQAPFNYFPTQSDTKIAIVFGDVYPVQLQKVANSLSL